MAEAPTTSIHCHSSRLQIRNLRPSLPQQFRLSCSLPHAASLGYAIPHHSAARRSSSNLSVASSCYVFHYPLLPRLDHARAVSSEIQYLPSDRIASTACIPQRTIRLPTPNHECTRLYILSRCATLQRQPFVDNGEYYWHLDLCGSDRHQFSTLPEVNQGRPAGYDGKAGRASNAR